MFDAQRKNKIHWEITDLCNLKCPMCPRTDTRNRCRPVKGLQHIQFFFKDAKKLMPEAFLKQVQRIDFCGNFGDPCMARDFFDICEMLIARCGVTVMVSTNGSMRRPQWWERLGRLFAGTPSWLEFHVDGLADTNHLYRIGARWENIAANAAAFIAAGGRADWHFILFKHNQHQVQQAREMARAMGFAAFVPTDTGRFPDGGKIAYMHPEGDWRSLEQATVRLHDDPDNAAPAGRSSHRSMTGADETIVCTAAEKNRFFIDAAGYLAPCCWVSNRDPLRPGDMLRAIAAAGKDPEHFNIRRRPIADILKDDLFSRVFPQLWGAGSLATCRKKCGRGHRNVKIRWEL
ncbi:MAG: hypothetical protein AMJ54_16575 [Deltaproteobacteria bacterium SG8_13]|nr:MAG: hypothetical protein AMJ54_16575 [Deltaproteobacteria bacterium SG8_13]